MVITAPAGFGKTTVATMWAAQVGAAWLSLDEDDNESTRFLLYLLSSLNSAYPGLVPTAQTLTEVNQATPPRAIMSALINDVAAFPKPVYLVLDDYHVITETAIHDILTYLIAHMPPNFHLVMVTRVDPPLPLARLRARGQLVEIRVADLRFTLDESVEFFNSLGVALNHDDVARLEQRTEGWIAGLQMAALSLTDRDDAYKQQFVAAFTGSHRHILDYLADEVLQRQPQQVIDFLLQTAVLDHLTASLCDSVTHSTNSEEMLHYLEHSNLFIIPLDEERQWYRYHHLFADVLRHRLNKLQPEQSSVLHKRASIWYEQHELYGEAMTHALAANETERAAALLENVSRELWARRAMVDMYTWFKLLPESVVGSHPRLVLLDAQIQVFQGHMSAVEQRVRQAEQLLQHRSDTDPVLHNELIVLRSMLENFTQGDRDGLALAQQATEQLPQDHPLYGVALLNTGIAHWLNGEMDQAEASLVRTRDVCLAVGNTYHAHVAMAYYAQVQLMRGLLQDAIGTYRAALDLTPERRELPDINGLFVGIGALRYEQDALEAAQRDLEHGTRLGEEEKNSLVVIGGLIFQAYAANARHHIGHSQQLVQDSLQVAAKIGIGWIWCAPSLSARWMQLMLLHGDTASAERLMQRKEQLHANPLQHEVEQIAVARLYVAQANYDDALAVLNPVIDTATRKGRNLHAMQALILKALALRNSEFAYNALERALTIGEPEGFVRLFVDEGEALRHLLDRYHNSRASGKFRTYTAQLLRAFAGLGETPAPSAQGLEEPLSERELEILGLMAQELSNSEIAERLYLSVTTIKKHGTNIFGKLGVSNRQEAVDRARELRLIR